MTDRKKYITEYRKRNLLKIRKYNRDYMRKKRGTKLIPKCRICGAKHRIKNFHKVIHR